MLRTKEEMYNYLVNVASLSPCDKRKVGAIIAKYIPVCNKYDIIAHGYNKNLSEGPCECEKGITKDTVVHAEQACINAYKLQVRNYNSTHCMYVTHEPCTGCLAALKSINMVCIVMKKQLKENNMPEVNKVEGVGATLQQRGSVYGKFIDNADCTQSIMEVLYIHGKRKLDNHEREALHMIAHKMSRIVCGLKTKKDNWHDIAGYATLAEELTNDE